MRPAWLALTLWGAACGTAPVAAPAPTKPPVVPAATTSDRGALAASLLATAQQCQASDPERAWRSVGAALDLQSPFGAARILQAQLAWARSEPPAARAAWEAVAEEAPEHPWARLHRAMAAALGRFPDGDPAPDLAWLAAHADRDAEAARLGTALAAIGEARWDDAALALAAADAERWETIALRARCAELGPDPDRAAAADGYDRVLAMAPALGFVCAGRARCAEAATPGSGRAFWDRAIRSENWRADHRRDRGLSRLAAGDVRAAQGDLEWALRLAPTDAGIRQALARVALARGDTIRALAAITEALAHAPDDAALLEERARLLAAAGRWTETVAAWNALERIQPDHPALLAGRARALAQLGNAAAARRDLDRALERNPANADALLARALMRLEAGDARGALRDVDAALDADPQLADGYRVRARLRLARRDPEGAQADLDAFIDRGGVDGWAFLNRGRLRTAAGQLEGASADLERAVGLAPDDVEARLAQGDLAVMRGQLKAAWAAFDRVVRDHAAHRGARAKRGLMHAALAEWRAARTDLEAALSDDDGVGLNDRELAAQCRMALADMRARRK